MHRGSGAALEVLLVHPGGPFWARKDDGAWSLPKGEYAAGDDPLEAARREFGEVRQAGGKQVVAWAVPGDLDVAVIRSNTFDLEWPPKSGRVQAFPEVDRAAWFPVAEARVKLLAGQHPFLDRLVAALGAG